MNPYAAPTAMTASHKRQAAARDPLILLMAGLAIGHFLGVAADIPYDLTLLMTGAVSPATLLVSLIGCTLFYGAVFQLRAKPHSARIWFLVAAAAMTFAAFSWGLGVRPGADYFAGMVGSLLGLGLAHQRQRASTLMSQSVTID